jgi:peroxiredoxin
VKALALAALCVTGACAPMPAPRNAAPATPPAYALIGAPAPAFAAPLAGGGVLDNQALKGHWTIIEFWGLWCKDSMADLPYARALARAAAQDPDLNFVTVHVDQHYGRWASVAAFVADQGVDFPIALDPQRAVFAAFQGRETPTYIVVDPDGVIRAARGALRTETNPDGGVKTFIREIAGLKRP